MYPGKILLGISLYDVCLIVGMLAALLLADHMGVKCGFSVKLQKVLLLSATLGILLGLFGAVLFQAFYNFMDTGKFKLDTDTGMTFYGGLILGAAAFLCIWFFVGKKICRSDEPKKRFSDVADIAACVVPLAHGFGRIGCLMAGCCHGKVTSSWIGIAMEYAGGAKVIPVQLFEALFLFALSAALFWLFKKRKDEKRIPLLPVYCIVYGVWRFFIEYLRSDERGETIVPFLTPSQLIAVLLIVVGGIYFALWYLKKKKQTNHNEKERMEK